MFDLLKNKFDALSAIIAWAVTFLVWLCPQAVVWILYKIPLVGEGWGAALENAPILTAATIFCGILAVSLSGGLFANLWWRVSQGTPPPGDLNWVTAIVMAAALFGAWWLCATVGFHIGEAYYWHPAATIIGVIGAIIGSIAIIVIVVRARSGRLRFRRPWRRRRRMP